MLQQINNKASVFVGLSSLENCQWAGYIDNTHKHVLSHKFSSKGQNNAQELYLYMSAGTLDRHHYIMIMRLYLPGKFPQACTCALGVIL